MKFDKSFDATNFFIILFFSLFPILPDYFRVNSRPIYVFVSILTFAYAIIYWLNTHKLTVKKDGITVSIILYSILILIPIALSSGFVSAFINSFKYIAPILITIQFANKEKRWNKIVDIIILTSVPVILLSYFELLGFNIFSILENFDLGDMGTIAYQRMGILRLESSFGHSIPYAIYLSFISLLVQYKVHTNKDKKVLTMKLNAFLVVIWLAVILTLSRAPMAVFFLIQFLNFMRYGAIKKLKLITKAIIAVGFLLLLLFIVGIDIGILFKTIYAFIETLTVKGTANSSLLSDFGTNMNPYEYRLGLFSKVFDYMRNQNISFLIGEYGWVSTFSIDNGFLSILIFNGIFGLVGRLILYCYALFISITMYLKRTRYADFYFISTLIIVGYILNLTSVAEMGELRLFLIIIGLIFSMKRLDKV